VLAVWQGADSAGKYLTTHHKTMAIQRMGPGFIGEIHLSSTKGHIFVHMATDYFAKSVEAVPLKHMTQHKVISFVMGHILYWFRIP
jgi:hypothetical protein